MNTALNLTLGLITLIALADCAPQSHVFTVYVKPNTTGLDPGKLRVSSGVLAKGVTVPYAISFGNRRIDLIKGTISDLLTRQIVRTLSDDEASKLDSILSAAVLATSWEAEGNACMTFEVSNYALLETDSGFFYLGSGDGPCSVIDLFANDGSGRAAGLAKFLSGSVSN